MKPWAGILVEAALAAMVVMSTLNFLSSMGPDYHARGDDPTYIKETLQRMERLPVWGPVYTSTLALFVDNAETANQQFVRFVQVLFTALILSFYLAVRTAAVPVGPALLFTLLLVLSGINPYRMEAAHMGSSFISHLAVLSILLAVIAVNRLRATAAGRTGLIALGLFLSSYIRPELLLACIGLSVLYLWLLFRPQTPAHRSAGRKWFVLSGVLAAGIWTWYWGGLPMGGAGAQARQAMAFGQHFAVNLRQWEPELCPKEQNPWSDWEYYANEYFGEARGAMDSAVSNPRAFSQHVARNLVNFTAATWRMFIDYPLLADTHGFWRLLDLGILALALYLLHPGRHRHRAGAAREKPPWMGLPAMIIALPSLLASLLYFPRDHYMIFIGVMALLWLASSFYRNARPAPPGADIPLLVCALFVAAMHFAPRGSIPAG